MHKRSFFIIEAIVSLLIFSMLVAILMALFSLSSTMFQQVKKKQVANNEELFIQNFLFQVFSSIVSEVPEREGIAYFFTQDNMHTNSSELIFPFDNKWQSDSDFSNHLFAKLYVTANKELCLATWPLNLGFDPDAESLTVIKIAKNITKIDFAFFPDDPSDDRDQSSLKNKNWRKNWPKELAEKFPSLLYLTVYTENSPPLSYYFFVPAKLPNYFNFEKTGS